MIRLLRIGIFLWGFVFATFALPVLGQPSPEHERATLTGVSSFNLVIDLEVGGFLQDQPGLDTHELRQRVLAALRDADLKVSDSQRGEETDLPYLYVHVNMLDAGNGLVPFSVQVHFYQAVQLLDRRAGQVAGSTWQFANVGIVSQDLLGTIADSVLDVVGLFIDDFQAANP